MSRPAPDAKPDAAPELRLLTPRHAAVLIPEPGARFALARPRRWDLQAPAGRTSGKTDRAILTLDDLAPDAEHVLQIEGLAPLAFRTPPCAGLSDISRFGADEAAEDNAPAIAAAIEATPPGGTVLVPPGLWRSAPIFLRSGVTLHLAEGATLQALSDRARFPILPSHDKNGRMLGSWEGLPAACYAALVTAIDARDVAITGRGTLDGGGAEGDWWTWPKETRSGARRPRTLSLVGCERVRLSGVTIRNSPSWTVHPLYCRDLLATGLSIENPPDSPNTDGFDPESCEDVTLEGLRISVGDDCIAIKAGKRGPEGEADHLAPTRRVTIRHCLLERGHGGVVIGSEMSGDVSDVDILDCDFRDTDRGLRIKTRRGRGGAVARIRLARSVMERVGTAVSVNAFYYCDPDGRADWVQSRDPAPVTDRTPRLGAITVEDVVIRDLRIAAAAIFGLPEAPVTDVTLRGLAVAFDDSLTGEAPDMALGLPVLHHAGVVTEFAELRPGAAILTPDRRPGPMLTAYLDAFAARYQPYKGGAWCYEDGCIYRGLALLHETTGDRRWLDHLKRLADAQVSPEGALKGYEITEFNIDNILSGRALIALHARTGDPRYLTAASLLGRQLDAHPRTRSGVYWHKSVYPAQVWLDGLYMGLPFQVELGQALREPERVTDALRQFETALRLTWREKTGLYVHGVDEGRLQAWADPVTGQSPAHWARALGWLAMAMVDVLELVGPEASPELTARTCSLLERLVALRRPSGLWLQVVDQPDLPGNYEESSASAMFAYALLKAARLGLAPASAGAAGAAALDALARTALRPVPGGGLEFGGIVHVAGLGGFGSVYRDGTPAYYLTEPVVADDAKGVGPLMMASAENHRCSQLQAAV
jgi:polygalacturonase/rhamnogalacturonyl hydrolase YesR